MSTLNNTNVPEGILTIVDKDNPPQLNPVKKRCLILSPTVNAGLEPESKLSDFQKEREIGKGGFGLVWKVIHKKTQKVYCIKVIQKNSIIDQKLVSQMNREIEIMYILNHSHCLRLKNHFEDDYNFYLVMPLAVNGQLYRLLKRKGKFDERSAAQILRETISALQYLHSFNPPIIHRDIKPENLLLNESGRILLADFGWSNFSDGDVRKTFCGTPEYIAPEMLLKKGHDTRVDIWSVGVLMFELLAGYSPFIAKGTDLYQNIRRLKIHWPKDMPPLAKNLISRILKLNPLDRPSLQEILDHQWFKQIKMLRPLLENKLNSNKDLLIYHMLSGANDEILERINKLLNLTGKEADNTNAKSIMKSTPDSEEVINKNNIMKKIQSENKNNQINQNNQNNINDKNEKNDKNTPTPTSNSEQSSESSTPKNSITNISSIDVIKQTTDLLLMENASLKKDNDLYKTKLLSIGKELRNAKIENGKLKQENTTSLQELIKKKDEEIEKLKTMDKERKNILTELDEKNKINMELNNKIQLIKNECLQKDKTVDNIQNKIKDLNKQLEIKEITINEINKKNDNLEKEKEQKYIDYQKKIEEMQNKVLNNSSNDDNMSLDINEHIEILNTNIDEFKRILKKKLSNFDENFNQFKEEFKAKDETFNKLLNDSNKAFNDMINSNNQTASENISKIFIDANKPVQNVKDQKIDWLNKQVSELSEYKKKGKDYENQIRKLTEDNNNMDKKLKILEDNLALMKKNSVLKDEAIVSMKSQKTLLEQKYNDMRAFINKNLTPDLRKKFQQAGL